MRAILIGHGSNASYWLHQLKSHPQTTLVAIVNDEADTSFGDAGPPVFDSLNAALENTQANAVLLSGGAVFEHADRALSAGLSLVLANSESMVRDDVRGLTAAKDRGTGNIFAPRILQYQKCRKTVRRFLQSGHLGAIGLVSCIDRHGTMLDVKDFVDQGLHLVRFGASQLLEICDLFDCTPLSIMGRITRLPGSGSCTEAFLELGGQMNIHYFGSLDTGID